MSDPVRVLLRCRDYVLAALRDEMTRRGNDLAWIERERDAVAVAANAWAEAQGLPARVTVADVERVESGAIGHSDYGSKLALYVAEIIVPAERPGSCR